MPASPSRIEPAALERGAGAYPVEEPFYTRADDGVDLRELFDILLRGKWIILGALLAGVVLTGLYSALTPSRYASNVILLVEKQDTDLASILPTDPGSAFFRNERNLANELLVLRQSYPLAEAVAQEVLAMGTVAGDGPPVHGPRAPRRRRASDGARRGLPAPG